MREYQMEAHPQMFRDQARRSLIWIWNSAWGSHFKKDLIPSEYILLIIYYETERGRALE